jgi:outer membrane receptor protein involved in Fe transport
MASGVFDDNGRMRSAGRQVRPLSVVIGALVALVPAGVFAQTVAAGLEGRVLDATGAALSGVSIEARGPQDTRSTSTDADGTFRLAPLAPGRPYTVSASLAGFRTVVIEDVDLPVNAVLRLDLTMTVASQAETVTVRAEVPPLDGTTPAVVTRIDGGTIRAIPLDGRNYLDLVRLTPGVTINEVASTPLAGRDTRGSILGERAANASFFVDGVENNDDFRGGVFQDLSLDAVQEFEVIAAGAKAEFGGGSGGIVNVVTRSGANTFSGVGYFFVRDDALDASNVPGEEAPELSRRNYGFTLGGPVSRDRDWFFGSAERIREEREAIFAPNIPAVLGAEEDFSQIPGTDDYRLFGKYTRTLSPANQLRGFASWTHTESLARLAGPASLPSTSDDVRSRGFLASAGLSSLLGARALLDTSFAMRDHAYDQNSNRADARSFSILFRDDGSAFEFGPRLGSVQALDERYYTFRETVTVPTRRHTVKAGVDFTHTTVDGENAQGLTHVIVTTRANFASFGRDSFQIPQGVGFASPEDALTDLDNNGVALFGQDDWQIRDDLTLNLGLRYEYDSRFDARGNVAPRLGAVWRPAERAVVRASWGRFYDRYRLGIAQAVPELGGFDSRTVVEIDYPRLTADALPLAGGLALMAVAAGDPFVLHRRFDIPVDAVVREDNITALTGFSPGSFLAELNREILASGLRIAPVDFSPFTGYLRQDQGASFQDAVTVKRPFETPHNDTLTVGTETLLGRDTSVGVTYAYRRIRDILGVRLTNLAFESRVAGRPITTDGGPLQRVYGPWYDGTYRGLMATFSKRFGSRHQVQANYTYARSTDNLLNTNLAIGLGAQGAGSVPTDNLALELDRGNSNLSVPHTFVASGVASLPLGLSLSGVWRATSGVHFSAAGTPVDVDGDGIQFTRPLSTERNEFHGPSTENLDLRLEWRVGLVGRARASLLLEFFNVTNARNPRVIENAFVGGRPVEAFGETRVPLPGREGQMGVRFEF